MSGSPAGASPGGAGARGLTACGQCRGIVPGSRLVALGDRLLCADCARRATAAGGPSPGASEPPPPMPVTPRLAGIPSALSGSRSAPAAPAPPEPAPRPASDDPYGPETRRASRRTTLGGDASQLGDRRASQTSDLAPAGRTSATGGTEPAAETTAAGRTTATGRATATGRDPATDGATVPGRASVTGALPPWSSAPAGPRPGPATGEVVRPNLSRISTFPNSATAASAADAAAARALPPTARPAPVLPPSGPRTATAAPSAPATRTSVAWDEFAEYAALRSRIDGGEDTLETRRAAADLAGRLGLTLEASDHYRRCVELDPGDARARRALENTRRATATEAAAPSAPARRVIEEDRPFWAQIPQALAYPLRGSGPAVLAIGGLFFGAAQLLAAVNVFAGLLSLMLAGYVVSHLFGVVNATASGKQSPPELPEASNVLESYLFPFFAFLVCAFLSFAPFAATAFAAGRGWLPGPVAAVLLVVTFAAGFFVFPMTVLVRAMFGTVGEVASPSIVLGSIGRILPDYVALFVATCAVWIAYGVASTAVCAVCWATLGMPAADAVIEADGARIVSWVLFTLVTWPLFLYAWTLQGHLLGRVYRQSLRRLAWFVSPDETSLRAQRLSSALGIAAGVAVLGLCGAAWGAGALLGRMGVGPAAATLRTKCPIRPGARLVYYWENTDGPAGLTEYRFEPVSGGVLRVVSSTRIAGRGGEPAVEDLGTFDTDTGIWDTAAPVWGDAMVHDGRRGMHVPFYGPPTPSSEVPSSEESSREVSSRGVPSRGTWVNGWPVRGAEDWRGAWTCWKVHDDTTNDLFYDRASGVLVGSRFAGVGYVIDEWLVIAEGVEGAEGGPPPARDFSSPADDEDE